MAVRSSLPPVRYILLTIFTVMAVIFIVAPLAVIILNSFSSVAYNVFPPEGYSLRWYKNLAEQTSFYSAAARSVLLASFTTILSVVIGTMAAYALTRYRLVGKNLIQGFLLSPIVLPKIVLGVAVFMFFVQIGVVRSYSSLLLTHTLVSMPFVIAIVAAALLNFDWTVQEAAMDLGAGPITTFVRVILPEISVSMTLAAVLAFMTSFDQVETTLFLLRPGDETLPIEMFVYLQKWQDPTIAALSAVLIFFVALLVSALSRLIRSRPPSVLLARHRGVEDA
jgi:putative spermidine/putrescine transport system permease protein